MSTRAALEPMMSAGPHNFGRDVQSCCFVLVFLPIFTVGMRILEHGCYVLRSMDVLEFVVQPAVATLCFAWASQLLEKAAGRSGKWRWSRS
ncbi:hypothetical protein EXIGLDRAFT_669785 [Exidia glandulosa HHB12029]|uniref:Uncharacterized protein n=1 Tax=Exidia glandulosa HHB12029 TaxID=1314781 RepID=A0A165LJH4_EXIGL|nr:hypothetical protein EXIGLDRAFT_669785 [Exidia glandulosa HHB12029]